MNFYNNNVAPKHKVFISFHHADEYYKNILETQWGEQFDGFISKSVDDGDINTDQSTENIRRLIRDDFIADATVTLVLVGQGTWRRKYVDWEIASSIRDTINNLRTGLLGLLLPTYTYSGLAYTENGGARYNPHTIPPRLYDNIKCGFAKIYPWPDSPNSLRQWIHDAFQRRETYTPTNRRESFSKNRPEDQTHWED